MVRPDLGHLVQDTLQFAKQNLGSDISMVSPIVDQVDCQARPYVRTLAWAIQLLDYTLPLERSVRFFAVDIGTERDLIYFQVLALLQRQNKLKFNPKATGSTVDVSIVERYFLESSRCWNWSL